MQNKTCQHCLEMRDQDTPLGHCGLGLHALFHLSHVCCSCSRIKCFTNIINFVQLDMLEIPFIKIPVRDFPGGPVSKNPPCNAGDVGSISGLGTKIPHTTEQLSPRVTATEVCVLWSPCVTTAEPVCHNLRANAAPKDLT